MFQGPFIDLPYLPRFLVVYIVFALQEDGMGKKTMAYVRKHEEKKRNWNEPNWMESWGCDPDSSQKKSGGGNKVEFFMSSFMLHYKQFSLVLASVQGDTLGCE